jgi:hypothetical protein
MRPGGKIWVAAAKTQRQTKLEKQNYPHVSVSEEMNKEHNHKPK